MHLTYYAPYKDQLGFSTLFSRNCLLVLRYIIDRGDANITLDSSLAKTCPPGSQVLKPTNLSTKFAKLLHDYDLVNIWREYNVTKQDYTFYSRMHLTFSHIDYIFTYPLCISNCTSAKILETPWSDHSPVSFQGCTQVLQLLASGVVALPYTACPKVFSFWMRLHSFIYSITIAIITKDACIARLNKPC